MSKITPPVKLEDISTKVIQRISTPVFPLSSGRQVESGIVRFCGFNQLLSQDSVKRPDIKR